jgi:hypothetical protein
MEVFMSDETTKYALSLCVDGKPMYLTEGSHLGVDMTMGPKPTPLSESEAVRWKGILSDPEGECKDRFTNIVIVPYSENLEAVEVK